jgi:hypothetical protein
MAKATVLYGTTQDDPMDPSTHWIDAKRDWRSLTISIGISVVVAAGLVYSAFSQGGYIGYSTEGLIGAAIGSALVIALFPALCWPFFSSKVVLLVLALSAAIQIAPRI